ncbi:uncharacterized protein FFUJ_09282 [Fusarium fujikuroi IMI 58289]|uniref:Uncharacterized protein n=1 Tax=Gibberella fujikuroi (strain CBS 195.34 / IMI 58289 / NRRL A-6831) TaxID=1279085 RepID=S0EFW1_GIBF5|nr:uncharacterized protein FFUJ_09282 [Fusarium fujikuroi IMI 58289]KLP22285.1 uncharacterized protein LW94_7951 [Fusarium fujikuroi]CCT73891.1 uncharacterized protein FFUJ_09282 [Fusarium fujikuroi IMI 58289]SCO06421.1 uncharacterized protein FFE2_11147 [Fusarium fujikuroi]SCO09537.1 uncharacterized protein FFM5_09514 [Fusarium fujikuroi]SCO46846.1 uncharacterized protein FFNC_10992 [Fusarium fujikuroi]
MKFSTILLVLAPLVSAAASKEAAAGLPDLASASEKGHDLSSHGEGLQLAAKVCPAKFPRKCSLGNFCCRTLKCCKKDMHDTTMDGFGKVQRLERMPYTLGFSTLERNFDMIKVA